MDVETSDLAAGKSYTKEELRADQEFAREVFELLLPDENIRKRCLEFLANSIQIANEAAPDRWGITLYDDLVLMNCGMIEVMQILSDQIHVLVFEDSLPDISSEHATINKTRNGSAKGFYPSVPGSIACDFDAEKVLLMFPLIANSHKQLVQNAAQTAFFANRKNAHSPGVIKFLNEYLDYSLPQPNYLEASSKIKPSPDQKQRASIVIFHDEADNAAHDLFQSWRSENWEDGYFINYKSRNRLILHRAICQHPGGFEWTRDLSSDSSSLTKYKKICSADLYALLNWAEQQGLSTPEACKDCLPDFEFKDELSLAEPLLPEELASEEKYSEGAAKQILVNAYERDPKARSKCIAYYGTRCIVCKLSFEEQYGSVGKDFIHVHHLTPLSSIGESNLINPINDLRPVCANCHAIIHRRNPPYSIDEVTQMIEKASKK